MFSQTDTPHTTVIHQGEGDAFGRRSFTKVMLVILGIGFTGFIAGWLIFGDDSDATVRDDTQTATAPAAALPAQAVPAPQTAAMPAPAGIPAAPKVGAADKGFFGSLLAGLTSSPALTSTAGGDQGILAPQTDIDTMVNLELQKNHIDAIAPGPDHALADVLDRDVIGQDGVKAGNVHDILVRRGSGVAQAIIMREDESLYGQDLAALRFNSIQKQQEDGEVYLTVPADAAQGRFSYANIKNSDYISLRTLIDGQLLDYEGSVVGRIRDITYENAAAQQVYIQLDDHMVPTGKVGLFNVPFAELDIVDGRDGYDIKLTRAQTQSLAAYLYRPQSDEARP